MAKRCFGGELESCDSWAAEFHGIDGEGDSEECANGCRLLLGRSCSNVDTRRLRRIRRAMTNMTRIRDTTPATTPPMISGGRIEVEDDVLLPDELGPALPSDVELLNHMHKGFQ